MYNGSDGFQNNVFYSDKKTEVKDIPYVQPPVNIGMDKPIPKKGEYGRIVKIVPDTVFFGKYRCCLTVDDFDAYMESMLDCCAFDIETAPREGYRDEEKAAVDPHKADICGISFSHTPGTAIYVPLKHKTGPNFELDSEAFFRLLKIVFFERRDILKIAHNIAFESSFLYKYGIVIQLPVYDTIAASQLSLKNMREFRELKDSGLKTLTKEIFGYTQTSYNAVTEGYAFDELESDSNAIINYACADSDYTLQLYNYFTKWFEANISNHHMYCRCIDSPASVYTGLMKYNGITVDKDLMMAKKEEAENKISELRDSILRHVSPSVDIGKNGSTKALEHWMFDVQGFPVYRRTEKGERSMDDTALQMLIWWAEKNQRPEDVKFLHNLQEYRKWGKLLSTYIDGYLKCVNTATGRIHADLMPTITDTSRFASRNPNLQNIPRKDNDPVGIRNFFIPTEGNVFADYDFSQIELRVGAYECRDATMLDVYRNDGDIHAQTTAVVYNISEEQAKDKNAQDYKERRVIAKSCNFGVFFGLFPKGLQETLKFKAGVEKTLPECEDIIRNLKNGYPGLDVWQRKTKNLAHENMYSDTAFGYRRMLKGINSLDNGVRAFWERVALNTPIQGTAAGILKLSLARLLRVLAIHPQIRPILQVHDELLFECPPDFVDTASKLIRECMEEKPFEFFDVPIKTEGATGLRFGDLTEL